MLIVFFSMKSHQLPLPGHQCSGAAGVALLDPSKGFLERNAATTKALLTLSKGC